MIKKRGKISNLGGAGEGEGTGDAPRLFTLLYEGRNLFHTHTHTTTLVTNTTVVRYIHISI